MSQLTQEACLALAVQAEVARTRANQGKARAALLDRRVKSFLDAVERFERLHGRGYDGARITDLAEVIAFGSNEAADLDGKTLAAAIAASRAAGDAMTSAERTMQTVLTAWGNDGPTLLEWIGVDREAFGRAVAQALKEA